MRQIFILDEWLWSDLASENGPQKQSLAFEFLDAIYVHCDRIAIASGSRFVQKAYRFFKRTDIKCSQIAKYFNQNFLRNSKKVLLVEFDKLPCLPPELFERVNPDDHYLVQLAIDFPDSIIVSSDAPLIEILESSGLRGSLRDIFISNYLANAGVHDCDS